MPGRTVRAAGCVVWRFGKSGPEVLQVHRPRYGDWSFPKGKLDPGETSLAAAMREVEEETGLAVTLGPRLPDQHYTVSTGQPKVVTYWAARAPADADISKYRPNNEIDKLRWVPVAVARKSLTYPYDVALLKRFLASGYDSWPLLVVRHGQARSRKGWTKDDDERPLRVEGKRQAKRLITLLGAYGVCDVVSSDSVRCVDTVLPYVNSASASIRLVPSLSQTSADKEAIRQWMHNVLNRDDAMAVCSHRPVLPMIFKALGVKPTPLEPAAVFVIHRAGGKVRAVEQHAKPSV